MTTEVIEIEIKDNIFYVHGPITEKAELSAFQNSTLDPVIIDLSDVSRMNSYGIKKWIEMLGQIEGRKITYRNCPVFIVDQLNIVSMLREGVAVESFYAPFYCESCDSDETFLLITADVDEDDAVEGLNEKYQCTQCSNFCEFGDDEEYFDFLIP